MDYIDISKLRPERIAPWTRVGIMEDFYPDTEEDTEEYDEIDDNTLPYHARALCLYSILLITRLHELAPESFCAYYDERYEDALESLPHIPKYASLSEKQLDEKITKIVMTEIRNCFAHGNFEISYSRGTQKLFFVLTPKKSEIVSAAPIVISASDMTKAIWSFLGKNSQRYEFGLARNFDLEKILGTALNDFMLPAQLMKIADHYTDPIKNPKRSVLVNDGVYSFLQNSFLSAKITYEQDDYYNVFGKDSKIFEVIKFVRNSLAHGGTEYQEKATKISFQDRAVSKTESFGESVSKLLILDSQKSILKKGIEEGKYDGEKSGAIKEMFEKIYDLFFCGSVPFETLFSEVDGLKEKSNQEK